MVLKGLCRWLRSCRRPSSSWYLQCTMTVWPPASCQATPCAAITPNACGGCMLSYAFLRLANPVNRSSFWKQSMNWRKAKRWTCSDCLRQCPETVIFPADNALIENGCMQIGKRLPSRSESMVGKIRPVKINYRTPDQASRQNPTANGPEEDCQVGHQTQTA